MKLYRLRSYNEYTDHCARLSREIQEHAAWINSLIPEKKEPFSVKGYSYTAQSPVDFQVDFLYTATDRPNWRERVTCPITNFNNRMRAIIHLFDIEIGGYPDSDIYMAEQVTPIYTYFKQLYPGTIGSEYLGDRIPYGASTDNGIRNESSTSLTFAGGTFDAIISLDVLEHIPDFSSAFFEYARVLKPGGKLLLSVPFRSDSAKNIIRSKIVKGEIKHLLPPEYHGDPISADGVLCFQHFGWEMLNQMRKSGFSDAYAVWFYSKQFGYPGPQIYFIGIKKGKSLYGDMAAGIRHTLFSRP